MPAHNKISYSTEGKNKRPFPPRPAFTSRREPLNNFIVCFLIHFLYKEEHPAIFFFPLTMPSSYLPKIPRIEILL